MVYFLRKYVKIASTVLLLLSVVTTVSAGLPPSTPPPDDIAMWLTPTTIDPLTEGYTFNVTVWAKANVDIKGWQFWMDYNAQHLNATYAAYTAGSVSEYFQGVSTFPVVPSFTVLNATHNRVAYGESGGIGVVATPNMATLAYVTFEVVGIPSSGDTYSSWISISVAATPTVDKTYLIDGTDTAIHYYTAYDTYYSLTAPPEDHAPPVIAILSPQNTTYTSTSIQLTFTVNEPTSWMGYSLDGSANVTVTGNSTIFGIPFGSHDIIVYARDLSDNSGSSGTIHFTNIQPETKPTDVDGDGYTGIDDIVEAGEAFGSYPGHERWNPQADINSDEYVGIVDIALVAIEFGTIWP